MSSSFSDFVPVHARVFCWLSAKGVLDAVRNGIMVRTAESGDKFASFDVHPDHEQWSRIFELDPVPVTDNDGDILSVELVIGRRREIYLLNDEPYELTPVGSSPPISDWEMPQVSTKLGNPKPLDICPGLDGLLAMEAELIAAAEADSTDLHQACHRLVKTEWQRWVKSHGMTNARIMLTHLENLQREAYGIARRIVGSIAAEESDLREAIEAVQKNIGPDSAERRELLKTVMAMLDSTYWELHAFEQVLDAERKKRAEIGEAKEWAMTHGSKRLRKAVEAEVLDSSLAVYRDERLAAERPGWRWWRSKESPVKGIINPSEKALDLLMEARKIDPDASLNHIQKKGIYVASTFLGRFIVQEVENFQDGEPF
jgi:hypothetical protein